MKYHQCNPIMNQHTPYIAYVNLSKVDIDKIYVIQFEGGEIFPCYKSIRYETKTSENLQLFVENQLKGGSNNLIAFILHPEYVKD